MSDKTYFKNAVSFQSVLRLGPLSLSLSVRIYSLIHFELDETLVSDKTYFKNAVSFQSVLRLGPLSLSLSPPSLSVFVFIR